MCYDHMMNRRGAPRTRPERKNVTLRMQAHVYDSARDLVAQMPGVSLSDIVEGFLIDFTDKISPLLAQVREIETTEEALRVMDAFAANTMGQGLLQFSHERAAFLARKEKSEEG